MIAYLDSSVIRRVVLREENPLTEWEQLTAGVTSTLTRVEAARSLDRLAFLETLDAATLDILQRLDFVRIDEEILRSASQRLPLILGTLDAIHLAPAILYRAAQPPDERPLLFATHDRALAAAARAMHFDVIGAAA